MRKIRLYTDRSEPNSVEKSTTLLHEMDFVSKHEQDILNPIFELAIADAEALTNVIKYCNYCYIEKYHRSYFCSVELIRTGVVRLTCKVDYLNSWREYIYSLNCIIERNEKSYNLDINDGVLKTYQYDQISEYKFPNVGALAYNEFVLAVAGGGFSD